MKNQIRNKISTVLRLVLVCMLLCIPLVLTGCPEASRVNTNISKQARHFECERRITVYNARTD